MATVISADASPEKRLFISLLTRDIPLVAAFLDLIDNSINAAVEPFADHLKTARDYANVLSDEKVVPQVDILLSITENKVSIVDRAGGISAKTAAEHVFKFGRGNDESHVSDRLSVYGIGLKRAIFKLGNKIKIESDHVAGGFDLNLDVLSWSKIREQPWKFDLTERPPVSGDKTGTEITVSSLHDEVRRRISDGVFLGQLRDLVSRTYSYYLSKFVRISINGENIEGSNIEIGSNHELDEFQVGEVSCTITAGIGIASGGLFRARSSGWFVFCNGRAVLAADKTELTGWGNGLPNFQPKHRPFLGTVFFVSEDAEQLPWTTTKSAINEDSAIWQEARRHMAAVGRTVVNFLDSRYTDERTEVASADLQEASGARQSVVVAAVAAKRSFEPPRRPPPANMRIQYDAKVEDVKKIEVYLRRPGTGGAEVGRHTFHYFLRNVVGDK